MGTDARNGLMQKVFRAKDWKMAHFAEIHMNKLRGHFASWKIIGKGFIGSIAEFQHVTQFLMVIGPFQMLFPLPAMSDSQDVSVEAD